MKSNELQNQDISIAPISNASACSQRRAVKNGRNGAIHV
jgi:hypothetical protein